MARAATKESETNMYLNKFETSVVAGAAKPVLLNDLVSSLREQGWRNVSVWQVEQILKAAGAHIGSRKHGAGVAIYAAMVPFTQVATRHGMRPVACTHVGQAVRLETSADYARGDL